MFHLRKEIQALVSVWGESCWLRAGLWEQQVKQVILKMEVPNSLCLFSFLLHEFDNLFGTPVIREKCKWCLVGREETWCRSRSHPLGKKGLASKQCMVMKLHLITWLKGVFLIWEAALQTQPLFCFPTGRAGRGKENPSSRTPQLLTHPSGEGDAAARPMQTLSSLLGLLQRMTIYCPF